VNIALDSHDRIVFRFYGGLPYTVFDSDPKDVRRTTEHDRIVDVFLVYNNLDEVYSVLTRDALDEENDVYKMQWRGSWEVCLDHFTGLCSDLEIEMTTTMNVRDTRALLIEGGN